MDVFEEFSKIVKEIQAKKLDYALIGGVAMAFYTEPRFTEDIDILLAPKSFKKMKLILEADGYFTAAPPWTFQKTMLTLHRFIKVKGEDSMIIDILIAGAKKHLDIIINSIEAVSENGIIKVANKKDLIWLKKIRNSKQDMVDIEKLKHEKNR